MLLKNKIAVLVLKHGLSLHNSTPVEFQIKLHQVFGDREDVHIIDRFVEELAVDQEAETSFKQDLYAQQSFRICQDAGFEKSNSRSVPFFVPGSHE